MISSSSARERLRSFIMLNHFLRKLIWIGRKDIQEYFLFQATVLQDNWGVCFTDSAALQWYGPRFQVQAKIRHWFHASDRYVILSSMSFDCVLLSSV